MEFDLGKVTGDDGKGIVSIELISTSGKNKTYRITYTDETYFDYTVKDGDDAISAIVTSWEQTLSDSKVPSEKLAKDTLDTKVDKVAGKGLSTEDYTTVEKSKLAGIEAGANLTVVDSSLSSTSENPVQNKVVKGSLDLKANSADLATVATTGDYDDLTNKLEVVDELTSTDTGNPLSAKQGKILNDTKVDKVTGKGLSAEDYTTAEKTKLSGIEAEANKTIVDDDLSSTSMNPLTNRRTYRWLTLKADKSSLSTVATTGDYTDLTNKPNLSTVATTGDYDDLTDKPTIPSKTSDLTNDSGFVESTDLATVATTGDYDDLTNKPVIPPGVIVDQTLDGSSTDAVANQAVVGGLNGKSDTGHSHTWTTQSLGSYGTLYINETLRLVIFYYSRNYNYTSASDTTLETGIIPSDYRLSKSIPCASASPYVAARIYNGTLICRPTGTGTFGTTLQAIWTY